MKSSFLVSLLLLSSNLLFGQYSRFPVSGIVEYEKTINMYAVIKRRVDLDNGPFAAQAFESYKKTYPQFKKLRSSLTFNANKTLFTPAKESEVPVNNFLGQNPAAEQNNIIYTDLNTSESITQKSVFEETFLVKDSVRKINWKITDETREIAGYACRRANAVIMDSIYVVAFYTDQIPVSGGPESFTGLPGMILGVALPRENITWFATIVKDTPVAATAMVAPKKGKPADYAGLMSTLQKAMKDWGNYSHAILKAFLL